MEDRLVPAVPGAQPAMSPETGNPGNPGYPGEPGEPAGRRVGVLWVPDWPIVAAVAAGAIDADKPAALHDGRALTAVSTAARRHGLRSGMSKRTAQSLCPDVLLAAADEGRDQRAFDPIVQAMEAVLAEVSLLRPGLLQLGIAGAARYQGSEQAVAEALIGAAVGAGTEAQVGVADGLLAALLAAREQLLVPPGGSAAFLDPQPVTDLLMAATTRQMRAQYRDLIELWRRLGLATLGDIARLRPAHIGPRFGHVGLQAHRLASGGDVHLGQAHRPEPDIAAHAELDPPAARIDIAAFAARRLAEDVHRQLLRRGLVCAYLRVQARTEDGATLTRSWRIDGALTASELTDRVRWQLEGWLAGRSGQVPSAPLTFLEVAAEDLSPAAISADGLWGRVGRGEAQAHRAATRIQTLLGADGVLTPVAEGGRTPRDRIRLVAWGDEAAARRRPDAPWPGQIPGPLPATIPAHPAPVGLRDARGRPVCLTERGVLNLEPAVLETEHGCLNVTGWAGPWLLHERWWAGRAARGHLQALCGADGAYLLGSSGQHWWLEGIYD